VLNSCGVFRTLGHRISPSRRDRTALSRVLRLPLVVVLTSAALVAQVNVLTQHNDNARTGQNTSETILSPSNVNTNQFGKLFQYTVDGMVVAQPLYMSNVAMPGKGTHNVVFVVTQHDGIYAFDADSNSGSNAYPLWYVSLINQPGFSSVPINVQGCGAVTNYTEVGIMGTPVIDPGTGTMYVVAKTSENGVYHIRLHALDVTSGNDTIGPVEITATVNGSLGQITLDPLKHFQRPGLLLQNGVLYIGFGSNGCDRTHGWLLAYDAASLQQLGIFNSTPNALSGGSVWMGGSGPIGDGGNVFLMTANGKYDANTGGPDYSDSFLKFGGPSVTVTDYFTPYNQATLASKDLDLGSGGPTLLPDQTGSYPHVMVGAGKEGTIYLVNRDSLGHYRSTDNNQIIQSIPLALGETIGNPLYWNNLVYFAARNDAIKAYSLNGTLSTTPVYQSGVFSVVGNPSISANGSTNGLLWLLRNSTTSGGNTMLSAFAAVGLNETFDTDQNSTRDNPGAVAHFAVPTIANGKVYVGTTTQLVVYGLLPQLGISGGNNQTGAAGTTLPVSISVVATDSYTGAPVPNVPVTFADNGAQGNFSSTTVITDSTGTAKTSYTLPATPMTVTITASSSNTTSATFTETAVVGAPATLALFSGANQSATVATTLPAPIVMKVKDAKGNAVSGVSVTFSDNSTGSFNPVTAITDSSGKASTSYTLPTKAAVVKVTASSGTLTPVTISEKGVAGDPTTMNILGGNNQTAPRGTTLSKALGVSVKDQYGNAVPNTTVNFSDNGAGGTLSNPAPVTNGSGQVSVTYTLPNAPGTVQITATVTGVTPLHFNETAR